MWEDESQQSSFFQQLLKTGGLQSCLSLYCSMKYVSRRIKVDTERKGWMFDMDFLYLVQLWHEHTVKGWTGHSWRSGLRELHTWFLSSEWICLHVGKHFIVSPQKKILFRVLLLFNWFKWYCFGVTAIFNTADWWIFMFFLTVMSLQCSAVIVAHALFFFSGLVIQFFFRLLFFPSLLSFQISAFMTNTSSLCSLHSKERGACTSATLLWVRHMWVLVSYWMCEVSNTGNGTARILLLWNFVLGVAIMQTGPYYPGGFSTAEESSMNSFNILEEQLKCSKTQCFRTVSISDNEIVILLVGVFLVFYFLIKDK